MVQKSALEMPHQFHSQYPQLSGQLHSSLSSPIQVGEVNGWVCGDYVIEESSYSYGETKEEEQKRMEAEEAAAAEAEAEAQAAEAAAQSVASGHSCGSLLDCRNCSSGTPAQRCQCPCHARTLHRHGRSGYDYDRILQHFV